VANFSCLRRAEGIYLLHESQESSWREDNCRVSNVEQVNRVTAGVEARQVS
jgi:hypothetical protein